MPPIPTVNEAFQALAKQLEDLYPTGEALSIAKIVFEDALYIKHGAFDSSVLSADQLKILEAIRIRLLQAEPVQYVLGQADFYGLKFWVNPSVLIPRQETEELVFWALETLKELLGPQQEARILDIGTGSGCIAVTLAKKRKGAVVRGIDIDPGALEIAQKNAERNGVSIQLQEIDILNVPQEAFDNEKFHLIISNPPYIPFSEKKLVPAHVDKFEPHLALYVEDTDPLIFYKTIAKKAKWMLEPQGALMFECNEFNADNVRQLMVNENFKRVELKCDLNNRPRMVRGFLAP